jgi:Protein of unknown function (DUF1670).
MNMLKSKVSDTLKKQITDLIKKDYSMIAGEKIQQMFASDIVKVVDANLKEPVRLDVGQVLWMGVDKDDKPSYGKSSLNTRLKPIILSLVCEDDLMDRANGLSEKEVREKRIVRICNEAYEQGTVLSLNDVAVLLRTSISTVGIQIREYMEREGKVVPTRGTIHDLGRTFTHKRIIVGYYLEGMLTPEIARRCDHSEIACDRYIHAFNRVKMLSDRMTALEISRILEMSPSLVKEYLNILKDHNGGDHDDN